MLHRTDDAAFALWWNADAVLSVRTRTNKTNDQTFGSISILGYGPFCVCWLVRPHNCSDMRLLFHMSSAWLARLPGHTIQSDKGFRRRTGTRARIPLSFSLGMQRMYMSIARSLLRRTGFVPCHTQRPNREPFAHRTNCSFVPYSVQSRLGISDKRSAHRHEASAKQPHVLFSCYL